MSESQLKFASFDEAIEHLSSVTGKRVKIAAWSDESKEILKAITEEIKKKPALMAKFKSYIKSAIEPGTKVNPTTSGRLVSYKDVDADTMSKMFDSIKKAPTSEVFDIVQKDKESFPKFHETYKRGLQEQDGFYRGKPSLLQRGKDFVTGEEGEMSKEDREKADKKFEKKQLAEKRLKKYTTAAVKALEAIRPKAGALKYIKMMLEDPEDESYPKRFIDKFSDDIEKKNISVENAQKYEEIIKDFMIDTKKDLSKVMPEFMKIMKKVTSKVSQEVDDAEEESEEAIKNFNEQSEGNQPVNETPKQKADRINQEKYAPVGSDGESMIDNLINIWTETNLPKGE